MQIKSCLKTQGLLNVIHYTVYLFISNIGTGSPGGRQRQAERPKSRRVNYQQNELFHPQSPPPAPSRPSRPGRPLLPPACSATSLFWLCCSPYGSSDLFLLSFSFSLCPLTGVSVSSSLSVSVCFRLSLLLSLPGCFFLQHSAFCGSPWPSVSCNRDRDLERVREAEQRCVGQWR